MRSLASKGMIPAMSVLGSVSRDAWEAAETALIATLRESGADLLNLAAGGNQPRPRACEHLAENGRRTAALIHQGNPRARLIWEKRKEAGTLIAWLESRGDHVRVNRIRSALARLDLAEASCR